MLSEATVCRTLKVETAGNTTSWYHRGCQGCKSGGTDGASRMRVIRTRRLGGIDGSSAKSGSVSALPSTLKILEEGYPSSSNNWRTVLALSADSCQQMP